MTVGNQAVLASSCQVETRPLPADPVTHGKGLVCHGQFRRQEEPIVASAILLSSSNVYQPSRATWSRDRLPCFTDVVKVGADGLVDKHLDLFATSADSGAAR